jgi:hypothetical protein
VFLPKSPTRELYPDNEDFKLEWLLDKSMVLSMKGRPLLVTIEKIIFTILFYTLTGDILVIKFSLEIKANPS